MTVILKFKVSLLAALLVALLAATLTPVALASDPTRPEMQLQDNTAAESAQTTTAPVLPKLSMIRSQGSRHQALIDGQWLKTGENIGTYQVRNISASQVTLMQGERSLVLNLFQTTTTTK